MFESSAWTFDNILWAASPLEKRGGRSGRARCLFEVEEKNRGEEGSSELVSDCDRSDLERRFLGSECAVVFRLLPISSTCTSSRGRFKGGLPSSRISFEVGGDIPSGGRGFEGFLLMDKDNSVY